MKTVNSKRIKEALNLQELTPEEKEKRGILGRLYGPCASIAIPTRNGRFYDEDIWDDQFNNNDILKELINNGGCPMELDHPIDREETDSTKIAAMMSTLPQKDEKGNLICYCDIIDTPCGRIAYQLAKYGFKLGISSRATGDTYTRPDGTEGINPDTFQLTTFDLVLVPALANARLSLTESLTPRKKKLIESLSKEYKKSSEDDKKIMAEELNKLNIKLITEDLGKEESEKEPKTFKEFVEGQTVSDIEEATKTDEEIRAENKEALDAINVKLDNLTDALAKVVDAQRAKDELNLDEPNTGADEEVSKLNEIDIPEDEEIKEPVEGEEVKADDPEADAEEPEAEKEEAALGKNMDVEDAEDEEKDTSDEKVIADEEKSSDDNNIDKKESEHSDSEAESVEDIEDNEDLEKIKESLLKKYEQQESLEDTKSKLAVSEAKVKWLEEELSKYKKNSISLSKLARNSKTLKKDNLRLEEELSKNKELLNTISQENKSLKESLKGNEFNNEELEEQIYKEAYEQCSKVIQGVKEKLLKKNEEIKSLEEELDKSKTNVKNLNSKNCDLLKQNRELKDEKEELVEKYINLKSTSLGINKRTINESLNSKSIDEIDTVCDRLIDRKQRLGSLPFSLNEGVKMSYKKPVKSHREDDDYFEEDFFDDIAKL